MEEHSLFRCSRNAVFAQSRSLEDFILISVVPCPCRGILISVRESEITVGLESVIENVRDFISPVLIFCQHHDL